MDFNTFAFITQGHLFCRTLSLSAAPVFVSAKIPSTIPFHVSQSYARYHTNALVVPSALVAVEMRCGRTSKQHHQNQLAVWLLQTYVSRPWIDTYICIRVYRQSIGWIRGWSWRFDSVRGREEERRKRIRGWATIILAGICSF